LDPQRSLRHSCIGTRGHLRKHDADDAADAAGRSLQAGFAERGTRDGIYSLVIARSDGRIDKALFPVDCKASRTESKAGVRKAVAPPCSALLLGQPGTGMVKYQSEGVDLKELANMLSRRVGRPVINQTGLAGEFRFELSWLPDLPASQAADPAAANDGPSLFTALQEQLGLKLESSRGPVEVLVIESVERPTPN
jgi:uncharacterized protein (TIGR03435 family)